MADLWSAEKRSQVMSRIRAKNTCPELAVRSFLHGNGYRFTVNGPLNRQLPGKPDIVLPKYGLVVMVNGCFWHRHAGCKRATMPKSNIEYWSQKFIRNVLRDKKNAKELEKAGWKVLTIWECEVSDTRILRRKFGRVIKDFR
jgi:DNA mismatch endonuclease (patch repair protein)